MTGAHRSRSRPALAVLGVFALALAGCGGDGDDDTDDNDGDDTVSAEDAGTEPVSESGDSGDDDSVGGDPAGAGNVYGGELEDGSTLTVTLDVDESDALVAPFVEFRELTGVNDPVVWITGSLEVPAVFDDALGPPTGRYLTFVEPGADLISDTNPTSDFACGQLDGWFGEPSGDDQLAALYVEIIADQCFGQTLGVFGEVGATTDYVMVVEGESIPDFDAVYAGLLTELQPV